MQAHQKCLLPLALFIGFSGHIVLSEAALQKQPENPSSFTKAAKSSLIETLSPTFVIIRKCSSGEDLAVLISMPVVHEKNNFFVLLIF